jgi:Transposase DDE domain
MVFQSVFERFIKDSPVSVMTRGLLENVLQPGDLDALFERTAQKQYTRDLLFSSVVDLMSTVVCGIRPSVHAAYQACRESIPVSITALYDKINHIEPTIAAELVRHTGVKLAALVERLGGALPDLLPGYRVKILDGNCLASTEHRIEELRTIQAGPLPGKSLVVLDPALMLAIDVFPCEDGHAQERALLHQVLPTVQPRDLWIEDRNFCTTTFAFGVARQHGYFLVRQHKANLPWEPVNEAHPVGDIEGGQVWEQTVQLHNPETGEILIARRIHLHLEKATRDGDRTIYLITNLPAREVSALLAARLYRKRWTIETLFQVLEKTLASEQPSLGYPKAALFAFCLSLVAYNVLAVVKASLRAVHGTVTIEEGVSPYYLGNEIAGVYQGMMIAIPGAEWQMFRDLTTAALANLLKELAGKVRLSAFQRHSRGPKKPRPPRSHSKRTPHVATSRLLDKRKTKQPS